LFTDAAKCRTLRRVERLHDREQRSGKEVEGRKVTRFKVAYWHLLAVAQRNDETSRSKQLACRL